MTEIDVPDWVVEDVLSRYSALRIERGDNEPFPAELARQQRQDDMRAALTAALGAWVVPGPYRFLKNGDNPSDWLDRKINGEPPNQKHLREEFSIENAYTLRQEKPE